MVSAKTKFFLFAFLLSSAACGFFFLQPKLEKKLAFKKLKLEKTNWSKEFLNKVQKKPFPQWMLAQIRNDLQPYRERRLSSAAIENFLKLSPSN
ncbi:MAG: hypothetical protein WC371_01175, partial [Parachlamydiales bacterium]